MSVSLLSTKTYIPPARPNAIARPRLTEKIIASLSRPGSFVMLSSPAGFGKTTLLSECVSQIQQPVAWVSLDEGDNDPARFWSYLIAACQTAYAGVGAPAQALLQSPQPLLAETIPTILVNDIASLDQELVLVLDDYHVIQDVTIQAAFSFLLDHLPGKLHVLISTRIDPPWSLARFRARNQLVEIRAQDLRFTTEEAAAFLNKVMGLHLKSEDTVALEERTEGWIAGLQLAALSMQGREDISGFVKAFTGSHVYIADYLVEEVLKRQSTEMQEFLLRCSILDRLSPGLCEAVTGLENGRFMLEELCRANLFLISLDDEGEWYRYHHLFADLLRVRLQRGASRVAKSDLHRRAAAWYEKAGLAAEAIEHALAAEDYPHAVELVEKVALPMILQASLQTVEGWLQEIPQGHIAKSPQILVAVAWMYLLRGAIPQAIPSVERLKLLFSTPEGERLSPSLQGEWLAIQAELLMGQGKPEASRDLALRAREILPEVDPQVRGMIYITLAKAFQLTYDYDHAAEAFQMIAREARQAGDYTFEILGISGHAQMTLKQGQLHRTFDIVTEGIRRLEASGKKIPFGATLYGEMGEVYYYWGELDQARKYSQRSMEVSGKSGYSDPEIYHSIMLSKMFLMEGDLEAAAREMQKASDLAGQIPPTMVRENLIAQRVWIDLALDRLEEAEQLLTAEGFSFGDSFRYPKLTPGSNITFTAGKLYNSALRILLYRAKRRGDRSNLERGVDLAERTFQEEFACKHLLIVLETLLLASQLHAALGIERQSLIEAAKALELAEPEGFISIFVEEGEPVEKILIALQKSDLLGKVRPGYVQEILAAFPPKLPSKEEISEGPEVSSLVEALTSRELEVLRLIAEGDSNQVIAEKLVITVSAVKKHTGNIYGKLNINSRTQAVARARQLGLLSQDE